MDTSQVKFQRAYVPTTALAKSVRFDDEMMYVTLIDGRIVGVPIAWVPLLQEATVEQQQNYQIEGGGICIYWPEIDEDLSIAGMMAGVDWQAA